MAYPESATITCSACGVQAEMVENRLRCPTCDAEIPFELFARAVELKRESVVIGPDAPATRRPFIRLTSCLDCGKDVSTSAVACPHCGRPLDTVRDVPQARGEATDSRPLALGLSGSVLLFLGAFAPIVSLPFVGAQNYFQNGRGDGVIIILIAVVSALFAVGRKFRALWLTGLAATALLLFTFVNFQRGMSEMRREMETELAGNPFAGLGEMALQSVQLQWGWAVLALGVVALFASAGFSAQQR